MQEPGLLMVLALLDAPIHGLAGALDLTRAEMVRLAFAYSFERRAEEFVTLPA